MGRGDTLQHLAVAKVRFIILIETDAIAVLGGADGTHDALVWGAVIVVLVLAFHFELGGGCYIQGPGICLVS